LFYGFIRIPGVFTAPFWASCSEGVVLQPWSKGFFYHNFLFYFIYGYIFLA
jgi:hypothetical protein